MAAKTTTTSGFSILTRILDPFLLFAVTGILHTAVKRVYMNPLLAEMSRHLSEMEAHTADHSSAEYARLVQETQQDATSLVVISIAVALVTLMLAFAKQIVACCFGGTRAASSSNSGGSLAELLGEVSKWRNLRIPVIATAAILAIFQLLSVALLGASFPTAMHDLGLLSVQESLFLVAFVALFYLCMLAMTIVGSRRKEFSVLVLATLLLPTLLIPVCGFGLLHLHTKQVMGLGMSLLAVYDLLQGAQDQLYLAASCVYCYCHQSKAMKESKGMVVAKSRYFTYAVLFVLLVLTCAAIYYRTSKMMVI